MVTQNHSMPSLANFLRAWIPSVIIPTPSRPIPQPKSTSRAMPAQMKNKPQPSASSFLAALRSFSVFGSIRLRPP